MTSRERIIAALELKEPDVIPVAPIVRAPVAKYYGYKASEIMLDAQKFADTQLRGLEEFEYDAVWGVPVDEVAEALGCELTILEDDSPVFTSHVVDSRADFSGLKPPNMQNSRWLDFKLSVIRHLKERVGDDAAVIAPVNPPFMSAGRLQSTTDFYLNIIADPDLVKDLIAFCMEPGIEAARLLTEAGADVLWAPIPTGSANMISRRQYEEFCSPYQREFFRRLHGFGARIITHTCGKWADRFDLALNELPDMLHVAEADLAALKNLAKGRVGIMGQVKPVATMMRGTPEDVERECYDNMQQAGRGGGFILSADCGLPRDVHKENLVAMVKAAKNFPIIHGK